MDFDRDRATKLILLQNTATQQTAGARMMFSDLPAAQGFEHWIVDTCSWEGQDPTGAPNPDPNPVYSGLFLCPQGTPPPIADGSRLGMLFLPLDSDGTFINGSNPPASVAAARCIKEFVVPPQWFIRAIWNKRVGITFGIGSTLTVSATLVKEPQC